MELMAMRAGDQELPEGWITAKLGELATFTAGKGIRVAALHRRSSQYAVPVFGGNGIAGYTDQTVTTAPTIAVGRVGQKCGMVHYVDRAAWITDNALYPYSVRPGVDMRFLAIALTAASLNDSRNRNDLPLITQAILHATELPWPRSVTEQRAIAAVMSDVDALLEHMSLLINKRRAVKLAVMQQLLTGDVRLPGFTGSWSRSQLAALGAFSKGRGITREDVAAHGLPCIRYGELYTRYENYVRVPASRITPSLARSSLPIKTGDLLFAASGETPDEIGRCVAYLGAEQAYAGGDIIVLRPAGHDSIFLAHLMNSPSVAAQRARLAQGDAVVHISAANLGRVEVRIPSAAEQRAIANVLADMDAEIEALERQRDKLRMIKEGMVQQLLTGRVRVVQPQPAEAGV